MMIFVSILSISRSLTTTEMRENTISINALELVKVEKEQEKENNETKRKGSRFARYLGKREQG